jgi:hypothetical protein
MPKLVINSGTAAAVEYELKPGLNSLGRGFNNDFRLDDPSVSAAHAEIIVEAGSVTVKDLRSTNGTFVNRSQIREAFLQPGQVLSLGGVEMLFVAEAAAGAAAPGGVARTIALPQIGGIKITRPAAPLTTGGVPLPPNYPAPTGPAPNLTTKPTALEPGLAPPARAARAAPAAPPAAAENRGRRNTPAARPNAGAGWRCLGFGLGAAVFCDVVWILVAVTVGASPAPIAVCVVGALCGVAVRLASGNRAGTAFALLAAGCALLGMFLGETGQKLAIRQIGLTGYNLAGLIAGVICAVGLGGAGFAGRKGARLDTA